MSKWKKFGSQIDPKYAWETKDPKTFKAVWHYKIGVGEIDRFGFGSHS